jgi:DNA-binding beta-propeller fold protein YncE
MTGRGLALGAFAAFVFGTTAVGAETLVPTGMAITPDAAPGARFETLNPDLPSLPSYVAGQAANAVLSPDARTLLVLTSGFNRYYSDVGKALPGASAEYVFVYDVSGGAPVKKQVILVKDTYLGIAWAPAGDRFFVSGGVDDVVREYVAKGGAFEAGRTFELGHKAGLGVRAKPSATGVAVSPDGRQLLVTNYQNDSVSLIDLGSGKVTAEKDLRPGKSDPKKRGVPGGTYPRAVIWTSNSRAFVASERDRELIALAVSGGKVRIGGRTRTRGQPVYLATDKARTRLFAAEDNTDQIDVVDPATGKVTESIATAAPRALWPNTARLGGIGTNSVAVSEDGRTLLATNGGENALAVIQLGKTPGSSAVVGLIPTGWYPTGVAVRPDGHLYVVNAKSSPGPNPGMFKPLKDGRKDITTRSGNGYVWQLEKAGLLSLPMPSGAELAKLSRQVAVNDGFPGASPKAADAAAMAFLRSHIRHVIYIVKENRTYDQVLGDLGEGNGDPKLTLFGESITPNQHALAREFVDLDNFLDSGESSNTGWNWTTAARTNDLTERMAPVNYADRGLQYDQEGANRNINVGYGTLAGRLKANPATPKDSDILAGARDVAAPDGPGGIEGGGYLWDSALRAGKTIRNYGFYDDLSRYFMDAKKGEPAVPLERDPFKAKLPVSFVTKPALMPHTDVYYRGFDQAFPDYWRFKEWEREFDGYVASGKLPDLTLLRIAHDHTGDFEKAIDGINTVETELADNDWAVGLVIEKLAKSRYAKDTLVFIIEDDAQDGADHVDAHRSIAFVAGPYVKRHAVVSRRYTTVSMLRTMEDVLGIAPMGLNDGLAEPMSDVFDIHQADWSFKARVSDYLRATKLPVPPSKTAHALMPRRSSAWWAKAMAGQDFKGEDRLDTVRYNQALWEGLKGGKAPAPKAAAVREADDKD